VEEATIYSKLTPIFRDVFDDDSLEVNPTLSAKNVDGWDSLRNIRLMLTVEKSFGVRLSSSEIGRLQNVGNLVHLLQTKLEPTLRS
jgi:acyl carrier protein